MFKEQFIGKAPGSVDFQITADRSRCMRMRFDRNACTICVSNCHAGAITIDDEITIDPNKCTLCMVCVSECPGDCFDLRGDNFVDILTRLRKMKDSVPYPVLGCNASAGGDAHEKMPCVGALSDEHLIALDTFMESPVQINLTACAKCRNSFVIDTLKKRITDIREATGLDVSDKAVLIENRAELRFEAAAYDRRGFFSAVKNIAFRGASGLFEKEEDDVVQSYSEKKLPLKRGILNITLKTIADRKIAARLLQEYSFTVRVDAHCDNCFACIGLCPTGALKCNRRESGIGLLFNSSMCNGCGLCRDFCLNHSIVLLQGHSGENYFEHEPCNNDLCTAGSADCRG